MKKSLKSKILAFSIVGLLSFNMFQGIQICPATVGATQTIEELEVLKDENKKKIAELQDEILKAQEQYENISKDENAKLSYQNALNEKIELQNQNIEYVMTQIDQIDADIDENRLNIADLEAKIIIQNADIEESIELFKQRIRTSYMSGSANLAAVFTGSSDFYDMLAKMELVSRVAEHDDKLINTLKEQLEELERLNIALDDRQKQLDASLSDASTKKDELSSILSELENDYNITQSEIEKLNFSKEEIAQHIANRQAAIAEQEKEHDELLAEIAAVQEAMRQESIRVSLSESVSVSESISVSVEESKQVSISESVAESKRVSQSIEESKAESRRQEEESRKPVVTQAPPSTQAPVQTAAPVTAAPVTTAPPPVTTAPPSTSSGFAWPVPGFEGMLSSSYGYRDFDSSNHKGIDISGGGIAGAAIVAADSGVVVSTCNSCTHNYSKYSSCGCGGGYGNYVTIAHNDGTYSTLYGHCSSVIVTPGQSVTKGQTIAYVGTTGYSTGNHLHFEVHKNGVITDPMSYYK